MGNDSLRELLPLLRCVTCHGSGALSLAMEREVSTFQNIALRNTCIKCDACGATYAITEDNIPIMLPINLRALLEKNIESAYELNLAANIYCYNLKSDKYSSYDRRITSHEQRLKNATLKIMQRYLTTNHAKENIIYHLDIGCGPGHVIEWLSGLGLKQVGLDVSLANLRNTKKNTEALVVLGDARSMPFRDNLFNVVTESSVLHHIDNWPNVILEACRVCASNGGIIMDSEPSRDSLDWSILARIVFGSRWYIYYLLSFTHNKLYNFRDIKRAKYDYWQAEIHHQPGTGFSPDHLREIFNSAAFSAEVVLYPDVNMETPSRICPSWKQIILQILSGHNPWDPKYGPLSIIAFPDDVNAH